MNKIFYVLVFLSLAGAGILFWLMKSMPEAPNASKVSAEMAPAHGEHPATESTSEVTPKDVRVMDLDEKKTDATENPPDEPSESHEKKAEPVAEKSNTPGLSLSTEPVGAHVFLNNEFKGNTPIELTLKDNEQELRLEAEGFEDYKKIVPKLEEVKDEAHMNWKIQMKKIAQKKESKVLEAVKLVAAKAPSTFYIQLKSVEKEGVSGEVEEFTKKIAEASKLNVLPCKVEVQGKGLWTRILVGPFASKKEASAELEKVKKLNGGEAFIVGAQKCQP